MIAADPTISIPFWLAVISAVLGVAGTVGASVAVFRQYAIKATMDAQRESMDLIIITNKELRSANEDMRKELEEERRARANLEGKLEVFTSHFADRIVEAVINTIKATGPLMSVTNISTPTTPRSPDSRDRKDDL